MWQKILQFLGLAPRQEPKDNGIDPHTSVTPAPKPAEPVQAAPVQQDSPDWMPEVRKYKGKQESDSVFSKFMSKFWRLVGLDYTSIQGNARAWCALFIVMIASTAGGYKYASSANARKQGEVTGIYHVINWKVDGIPEGAIVHVNHKFQCHQDGDNHVAFSNGSCAAKDLKPGVGVGLIGGNQGNEVSLKYFDVREICEVRYFKERVVNGVTVQISLPKKVLESVNCLGKPGVVSTK